MRNLGLTLAGGGNRAFVQIGFLERYWSDLEPRLGAISACSAGASVAITWLSGRREEAHEYWLSRRASVTKNFEWSKLLRGQRPTPHTPIYRATLGVALEQGGFERIKALPFPLLILTARSTLPIPIAFPLGIAAYSLERELQDGKLHPSSGRLLGYKPLAIDARTCSSPTEIVDLVLASSATPPFTPVGRVNGARVLDGGLVDNAPASLASDVQGVDRTLILLTRPYPPTSIGWRGNRLYLAPTAPVPINRWDYTSAERVEAALALGRRDALGQEELVREFLNG